jgi:hypothetical protein
LPPHKSWIRHGEQAMVATNPMAQPMLVEEDRTHQVMLMPSSSSQTPIPSGYATARNRADLRHFFELSSTGISFPDEEAELEEILFGEYLVDQGVVDRFQLFKALQMQDHSKGVRLGEAVAALGYAPPGAIERLFDRFQELQVVDVG